MDELSLCLVAQSFLQADDTLSFYARTNDLQNPAVQEAWNAVATATQIMQRVVYTEAYEKSDVARKVRAVFSANLTLGQYLNDERTTGGTDRKQRKALRQNSMKALQKLRQAVKSRLDEAAKMLAPVTIGVTSGDGELTMGGETAAV
jgi:hypothetical protein